MNRRRKICVAVAGKSHTLARWPMVGLCGIMKKLTNILVACTPLPADGVGADVCTSRCCCCAAFGIMLEGHPFGGGCCCCCCCLAMMVGDGGG